ncbi:MAG: hypothetical protein K6E62_08450 [Lachnospiraceae bacterium]|nr:hypothetical protein [Lachnospiraceae bacterium]
MNRNEIKEFAIDYIRFLIETQMGVDELYASLCYGGVIYDDTRIDLYAVFGKEDLKSRDLNKVADECSSNIGSMREYLADRSEDELIRDGEEPIAYIQLPADIWDALYGEADGEIADHLIEEFESFMDGHEMSYDLTEYGRNAILVYPKKY